MSYADRHLKITFRDVVYKYYPGHATPPLSRECRRLFDMGPAALWRTWFSAAMFEPDMAASLVWIARRQMAEKMGVPEFALTLDAVDEMITSDVVGQRFTVEFVDFTETTETPEIEAVTAVDEEGRLEVAADPED